MLLVFINLRSPSSEFVSPSSILDILENTLYPELLSNTLWKFVYIDLPWKADATIAHFSEATFIMETKFDDIFLFTSRDVRAEDKNEIFYLIKAILAWTVRSPIHF